MDRETKKVFGEWKLGKIILAKISGKPETLTGLKGSTDGREIHQLESLDQIHLIANANCS
jgi:hypothetical protein